MESMRASVLRSGMTCSPVVLPGARILLRTYEQQGSFALESLPGSSKHAANPFSCASDTLLRGAPEMRTFLTNTHNTPPR